jgi:hypothetical protein
LKAAGTRASKLTHEAQSCCSFARAREARDRRRDRLAAAAVRRPRLSHSLAVDSGYESGPAAAARMGRGAESLLHQNLQRASGPNPYHRRPQPTPAGARAPARRGDSRRRHQAGAVTVTGSPGPPPAAATVPPPRTPASPDTDLQPMVPAHYPTICRPPAGSRRGSSGARGPGCPQEKNVMRAKCSWNSRPSYWSFYVDFFVILQAQHHSSR